jgi:hypothetical protein
VDGEGRREALGVLYTRDNAWSVPPQAEGTLMLVIAIVVLSGRGRVQRAKWSSCVKKGKVPGYLGKGTY